MSKEKEQISIGECIRYWISCKGSLDLDTDESTIREFYNINHKPRSIKTK